MARESRLASHEPVRSCVACRQRAPKQNLIRVVRLAGGAPAVDTTGRLPGRAAYLHPAPDCLSEAQKRRAIERALKVSVPPTFWEAISA